MRFAQGLDPILILPSVIIPKSPHAGGPLRVGAEMGSYFAPVKFF